MVMEVLSKKLENAADLGKLKLHPKCSDPRLTHLLFADDLLVFSDGSRHSLTDITTTMEDFSQISGLEMNAGKSELFFGGYSEMHATVLSNLTGIKIGEFPTRYLGLPLNPSRITMATLQPFYERITSKLHSWTVKLLSFARKVGLITSVIYGMLNFWSSVFVLPKSFYEKVDSRCAAFLWKNKTDSAAGARVAWKDVCKPKKEGGLGIQLLEEFQMVFRLKQVWNFFSNAGSLWVAWLKKNVFRRCSFWLMEESYRLSGTVRSMMQLRDTLQDFLRCDIWNGLSGSFWFDFWTEFRPFIQYIGESGPQTMRVHIDDIIVGATRNGEWFMPAARSQQMETLQLALTAISPPYVSKGDDIYLWKKTNTTFGSSFSSKATWEFIRDRSPLVF